MMNALKSLFMLYCLSLSVNGFAQGKISRPPTKNVSNHIVTRTKKTEQESATRRTQLKAKGWVDLGLPSGTLWKDANEPGGFYTYEQAVSKFGNRLPTKTQFEELNNECTWTWNGSDYKVTGPSGRYIVLPATGGCLGNGHTFTGGGCYWSSTSFNLELAWYLYFGSNEVTVDSDYRESGYSIRLVQ